jgi:formylglycine-generating enzyme required for sulfatase activity
VRTVVFIGLIAIGVVLFLAKKWISDDTLQRLANAFATAALMAAALVFVVPAAPISDRILPQPELSTTPSLVEPSDMPLMTKFPPTDEPVPEKLIDTPTATPTPTPVAYVLGDTWTRLADSMVMVYVPAGKFKMGSDGGDVDYALQLCNDYLNDCELGQFLEEQQETVTLDSYWIDGTEVTNDQYRQCVEAQHCDSPLSEHKGSYTRHYYYDNDRYKDYPVIYINWHQAETYCRWADAELPTEEEWEYAARGPKEWIFPWGNAFDGSRLNYCDANCACDWCYWADAEVDDGDADTSAVGRFSAGTSWCGAFDMAGNVWEWTASDYDDRLKVHRGGSWGSPPVNVRGAYRDQAPLDDYRSPDGGFRCVKHFE